MDQMLVALSKYRKSDAGSSVEEEYVGKSTEGFVGMNKRMIDMLQRICLKQFALR